MNGRQPRGGGFSGWFRSQYRKRPKPLWMVIAADLLLFAVALNVFALFHHVLPRRESSVGLVSSRDAAAGDRSAIAAVYADSGEGSGDAAATFDLNAMQSDALSLSDGASVEASADAGFSADEEGYGDEGYDEEEDFGEEDFGEATVTEAEPAAAVEAEPTAAASEIEYAPYAGTPGNFSGASFANKFSSGKVTMSSDGYQSANVNVRLNRFNSDDVVFYVADIYIRDISCLVTSFAQDRFGKGVRSWAGSMNKKLGGIIAINGDYYGGRDDGIVIRNGELYRSDPNPIRDVCVLFWDGTMETYAAGAFNAEAAISAGAYQAWNFGPALLDNAGNARSSFNSDVEQRNPRTAIGYFEPGHYCFVVVDGRQKASKGMTLEELSALMAQLGCQRAYNLDGGNTSVMVVSDTYVNKPSGGGRPTSDIIAIVDNQS